jgi:hypothetical protein
MHIFFYFSYLFYFSVFFIFLFFWAGLGPAQPTWTGLDPAQPVTGPSQWPGWAEQHACANARMLLQCASELKFTCTEPMLIKLTKKQKFAYLVLETEDAYSADGSSLAASLCLRSALTCLYVPFVFSATLKLRRWWRGRPALNWFWFLLCVFLFLSSGSSFFFGLQAAIEDDDISVGFLGLLLVLVSVLWVSVLCLSQFFFRS